MKLMCGGTCCLLLLVHGWMYTPVVNSKRLVQVVVEIICLTNPIAIYIYMCMCTLHEARIKQLVTLAWAEKLQKHGN